MRTCNRLHAGPWGPLSIIVPIVFVLAACAGGGDGYGQKQEQGEGIGAVIGDMLGSLIPGGGSPVAEVVKANAGTIGSMVGGAIGAALDEEDRKALEKATFASFDSGKTQSFTGKKSGVRGKVTPTGSRVESGKQCRSVKQEVKLKDGKTLTENVNACKGPDGWKA